MAKTSKKSLSDPGAELARLQARVAEAPSAYHRGVREKELQGFLAQNPGLGGAPAPAAPVGNQLAPSAPLPAPFGPTGITGSTPLDKPGDIYNAQNLANQQYLSQQIALNRPAEVNAFGSSTYMQDPTGRQIRVSGVGNISPETTQGWTGEQFQNQAYIDRALQAIAGEGGVNNQGQAGYLAQIRRLGATPFDFSGVSSAPTVDQFENERKRVEDSLYNRYSSVFEPQFLKEKESFEQQMADRGISPGNQQYTKLLDDLVRRQNQQREQVRAQATQQGAQEQQRLFENAVNLRRMGTEEQLTQRAVPFQEVTNVLGLAGRAPLPQFNQTSSIGVPVGDVAGPVLNLKGLANQLKQQEIQAGATLGAAGIAAEGAFNRQQLAGQQALEQQQRDFANQQALLNQQNQLADQSKPNFWSNLTGNILSSAVGAGVGSLFGGGGKSGGFFGNLWS